MKIAGYVAIVIGLLLSVSALFMDVSVATSSGYRVNNIGLMSTRQNYMIFGGIIAIAGLIVVVFSEKLISTWTARKCPYCAENISSQAIKCKHCGSDVTPVELNAVISDDNNDKERLDGVNVKYILGGAVVIFISIIITIILYRN